MFDTTINPRLLQDLKASLRGHLIVPGDEAYDSARRVWNGMIDKHPALLVRCAGVSDVIRSIQFARSQHFPVAVRGGGHSFAGNGTCDGGLVIDLSAMKRVQVDPVERIVWAQAGLTLGEFIRETQLFGLATPVGTASETGLAGLTLGGGMGWLMGKYGLTIDNLLAVEIVTADGRVLQASATEYADLFWGVRGGGGNFGIVTAFKFQLHPVGPLLAGMILHPVARAREVLHFYREFSSTAPDELTAGAGLVTTPEGHPAAAIVLCYCGSLDEGERLVEPIRKFGSPFLDQIRPMSYLELISMLDGSVPRGRNYYSKARSLKTLDDEALQTIIDYGAICPSPMTQIILQHVHGATSRVGPTETAFALRDDHYSLLIMTAWDERTASQIDTYISWTRALWTATERFATKGVYINFLGNEDDEVRAQDNYGINYERLVRIKNMYDPSNFFRINQNIRPALHRSLMPS